ncbi:MAG: hypothetical protein HY282_15380 [Nitrospirae bacterium]|nr:hypothetical protein [Candidatus Manganitrophaceae bacterium]
MKKILHILKVKDDPSPLKIIQKQAETNAVTVVLIQDAGELKVDLKGVTVWKLAEEGVAPSGPTLGYKELLDEIFKADMVVTW